MKVHLNDEWTYLIEGQCQDVLKGFDDNTFDSIVTDPPYELGFMGKKWDASGIAFQVELWTEVLRVLKPGGHLLAFGGTRTYHRMACAIEDAGFEVRDCLMWLYGTGFPKSLNIGGGRGTALKPACEPIILARKPLVGTVAANVQQFGTGALNIDGSRIGTTKDVPASVRRAPQGSAYGDLSKDPGTGSGWDANVGRWPANVLLDEEAAAVLDAQSGSSTSRVGKPRGSKKPGDGWGMTATGAEYADSGGASRFFYVAKPSRKERDLGCDDLPPKSAGEATDREEGTDGLSSPRAGAGRTGGARNFHPTVKPVELMRYLVRLVTPSDGVVLDPFVGSGTTGMAARLEGFSFVGIDMTPDYCEIARRRIEAAAP